VLGWVQLAAGGPGDVWQDVPLGGGLLACCWSILWPRVRWPSVCFHCVRLCLWLRRFVRCLGGLAGGLLGLLLSLGQGPRGEPGHLLVGHLALLACLGHVGHLHQQLWRELPTKPVE